MAAGRSELEDEFECAVCMECYEEPYQIYPCQHSFCLQCLQSLRSIAGAKCPKCRGELQQCFPDLLMQSRLSTCQLQCSDCNTTVLALHMKRHKLACRGAFNLQALQNATLTLRNATQGNASSSSSVNRVTFSCPYCDEPNLLCSQLIEHCNTLHMSCHQKVVCPVCASMPWGDPNRKSGNFLQHLNLRHRFEYDRYVDYQQDDDTMLQQAMSASMTEY